MSDQTTSTTAARATGPDVDDLVAGVLAGDRARLARAITLVESRNRRHRRAAQRVLDHVQHATGRALRIGITGVPGVGKSTTIDQFGANLIAHGHSVAVLAVDPTSQRSGGSILGDKTRMSRLSMDRRAFVRPSPTAGTLGGVARRTRETLSLVEAAGFDTVIVETVGVGQSETTVAGMVDIFVVLLLPGGGDELQGIKKGVIELADIVIINKADGGNEKRAERTASDYRAALHLLAPRVPEWTPPVVTASGLENQGLDTLWELIQQHQAIMERTGQKARVRAEQALAWMEDLLVDELRSRMLAADGMAELYKSRQAAVRAGEMRPARAVDDLLGAIGLGTPDEPDGLDA